MGACQFNNLRKTADPVLRNLAQSVAEHPAIRLTNMKTYINCRVRDLKAQGVAGPEANRAALLEALHMLEALHCVFCEQQMHTAQILGM